MNGRIVVVGDVLLDIDISGRSERLCPDAPAPVVDVTEHRERPGGAGLAALLCAAGNRPVTLVAPMADDAGGRRLATMLGRRMALVRLPQDGPTRSKTRVLCGGRTLVRLDRGGPATPTAVATGLVREALRSADAVLVSDYGAGTTGHSTVRALLEECASRVPVIWDPHPRGAEPVRGVRVVTPNLAEARSTAGRSDAAMDLAVTLLDRWKAGGVCVTCGENGADLAMAGSEVLHIPAYPAVGDSCGAGDRFAAAAAQALADGQVLSEAVQSAVIAASEWVRDGGADGFSRRAASQSGPGPLGADHASPGMRLRGSAPATSDGAPRDSLAELAGRADDVVGRVRAARGRLVAAGGCFDVLHAGHVSYLDAARRLGDALIVLLNSDESVRRSKGPSRPRVPAADRARVLLGLGSVDAVVVFDEDDPAAALDRLRPDIWAKGGDYSGMELPEAPVVRAYGGRVLLLPYLAGRSTSDILRVAEHESALTGVADQARGRQ